MGIANRLARNPSKINYLAFNWIKRSIDSQLNGTLIPKIVNAEKPYKAFKLLKDIYLGCYTQNDQQSDSANGIKIQSVQQITSQNAAQLYNEALRAAGLSL